RTGPPDNDWTTCSMVGVMLNGERRRETQGKGTLAANGEGARRDEASEPHGDLAQLLRHTERRFDARGTARRQHVDSRHGPVDPSTDDVVTKLDPGVAHRPRPSMDRTSGKPPVAVV